MLVISRQEQIDTFLSEYAQINANKKHPVELVKEELLQIRDFLIKNDDIVIDRTSGFILKLSHEDEYTNKYTVFLDNGIRCYGIVGKICDYILERVASEQGCDEFIDSLVEFKFDLSGYEPFVERLITMKPYNSLDSAFKDLRKAKLFLSSNFKYIDE